MQLGAEPLAELRAVGLVRAGLLAQPVVAVQRGDLRGAGDPHGDVEQADRVAAAREQHEHPLPRREQPGRGDALEQVGHGACPATNSSVGSEKPFIVTAPILSKVRCGPAASTTELVTITSPPAARAATREARFTARP